MHAPAPRAWPGSGRGSILALDVGGANLKAADGIGHVAAEPFELWRRPRDLAARLTAIVAARRPRRVVATMTGEIADCYPDRATGVVEIVAAVEAAASACGATAGIYLVDGSIVSPDEARRRPAAAAASNWHALARLAAVHAGAEVALLLDVGSTTTDILLLDRRGAVALASDDAGRMASGELVYTGIERTPLAALVRSLPCGGRRVPVAAETFARSQDVWLLLGGLPEDEASTDTCDGAPATRAAARRRIARSLLVDAGALDDAAARLAASHAALLQASRVAAAIERVLAAHGAEPGAVVLSGHGTALAETALDRAGLRMPRVSLERILGPAVSRAAPAHALALVAAGVIP